MSLICSHFLSQIFKVFPSDEASFDADPGRVFLYKGSNILVPEWSMVRAIATKSGTGFLNVLFTAVFDFKEVLGATRKGSKRKRDGETGECQKLNPGKISALKRKSCCFFHI